MKTSFGMKSGDGKMIKEAGYKLFDSAVESKYTGNKKMSRGEKTGVWTAFGLLELMGAYNMIRPSLGEPEKLEVVSVNVLLPHLALAALVYLSLSDGANKNSVSISLLPENRGLASTIRIGF